MKHQTPNTKYQRNSDLNRGGAEARRNDESIKLKLRVSAPPRLRTLVFLLILMFDLWSFRAAAVPPTSVIFSLTDSQGNTVTNPITVTAFPKLTSSAGTIVVGYPITITPPSTNALDQGLYNAVIRGWPAGFAFWVDGTTNTYQVTNITVSGVWQFSSTNLGATFWTTNAIAAGPGITVQTNTGYDIVSASFANGANIAITTNASGQLVPSVITSPVFTNATSAGGQFTILNPSGNTANLNITATTLGGQSYLIQSTPGGLVVGSALISSGPNGNVLDGSFSANNGFTAYGIPGFTGDASGLTGLTTGSGALLKANNLNDLANARNATANEGNAILAPLGGDSSFVYVTNHPPAFEGQLVTYYSGSLNPYFFFARNTSTGTNNYWSEMNFPQGIGQFGDQRQMIYNPQGGRFGGSGNYRFYMNGSPSMATSGYVSNNGAWSDKVMYVENVNPFDSYSGICIPMMSTNPAYATPIFTNTDGIPIVEANPFGIQIGSIPDAYGIGEKNAPGSYSILLNGTWPFYLAGNWEIGSETYPSQHYVMGVDVRWLTNNAYPLGIHFPKWVQNVFTFTNANNVDTMFLDEANGNVIIPGTLYVTNQIFIAAGGKFTLNAVNADTLTGFNVNTNASFNSPSISSAWTFDGATLHRLGIVLQWGTFPKFEHASGIPFVISRSGDSDLQSNPAGATQNDELVIDTSGNTFVTNGPLVVNGYIGQTVGKGLRFKEGSNAKQGVTQLNGTTAVTVSTTAFISTNVSRVWLTTQNPGGTPGTPYVSATSAGTSFSIKSTSSTDQSTVAWLITDNNP